MSETLEQLLGRIRQCKICQSHLEPNPILRASTTARLLIVGQAPGIRVHNSGTPWDDPSGDRLRDWLQLSRETFYDTRKIAIVPMGYCYPGTGKSGDLPPRKECAEHWLSELLAHLPEIQFTLLIGQYAQAYYLKKQKKSTLTATIQAWQEYFPTYLPLPHPSPRNNIWLKKNPWFNKEILPILQQHCKKILK